MAEIIELELHHACGHKVWHHLEDDEFRDWRMSQIEEADCAECLLASELDSIFFPVSASDRKRA